ncbi:MAG: glycosyltransferase [Candidatus Cloacimonetes bacterium]|jgi:glycosyltransferase involved in cell wall biosynthesis|nr:glycosyltransferase [Candidatus Cloacimonadota bacterium]MBT6005059.1 glycosyltransferase [Prolixibacteraceae bacterium]
MKNNSKISIIIPTFNASETLSEALNSIINQSFRDFEVLIMDGRSTDNTIEISKSYNDARIRIFSEKDNGIYDAMNKGIRLSKSEWLYFLGSDDRLANTDTLKDVNKYLSKDYELVYGNVYWGDTNKIYDGSFDLEKLVKQKNICHQAMFYNKNLFDIIGEYNTKYEILADYDFNIRCFLNNRKILYIDIVIAYYCRLGVSNRIIDSLFHKKRISILIELYEDIEEIYYHHLEYKKIISANKYAKESIVKKKIRLLWEFIKKKV